MWIPATFKSNRYAQWKEKSKVDIEDHENGEDETQTSTRNGKSCTAFYK